VPRPKRCRKVCYTPGYSFFKPQGIPLDKLAWTDLGLDELEALRLADVENLSQAKAAELMEVSQPTFNRILSGARTKVARCLLEGAALRMGDGAQDPVTRGSGARRDDGRRSEG
jgi:predicted DNA-binding protein (UPF0251 family)